MFPGFNYVLNNCLIYSYTVFQKHDNSIDAAAVKTVQAASVKPIRLMLNFRKSTNFEKEYLVNCTANHCKI